MNSPSPSHRLAAVAALVLAAGLAAIAPAAVAQDMPYESKIRLTDRFPFAHGKVKSDSPSCIANRKVRLFKVKSGGDKVLGKTRTDAAGKWTIEKTTKSGVYYAKVNQFADESTGLVCLPAKSKKVAID